MVATVDVVESPEPETLRMQYQELCKSHDGITGFRGKLLGLLPLASGATVLSLMGREQPLGEVDYIWAVAAFGFVISLGLFLYELRGMQICHELRARASFLERRLGTGKEFGQFTERPLEQLGGLTGAEGAGWIIYPAVLVGWIYLAGLDSHLEWWRQQWLAILPTTGYVVLLIYTWIRLYVKWRKKQRHMLQE